MTFCVLIFPGWFAVFLFVHMVYGQNTVNLQHHQLILPSSQILEARLLQVSQQLLTQLRQETQQTVNNIQTQTDANQRSINILLAAQSQTQYDELKEAVEQDRATMKEDIDKLREENQVCLNVL